MRLRAIVATPLVTVHSSIRQSSIRRLSIRLYVAALLMDTAYFCGWAVVPFLVKRGDALALSDVGLGALASVAALSYVAGTLGMGRLHTGDRRVLVTRVAGLISGLAFVLAAMAGARWQLFVALPLTRFALAAYWPNLMALVGEAPGRSLVHRIASFNCWWSSGKAVAFLLCGVLLESLGEPRAVLGVCGAVAIASVLLVIDVRPDDGGAQAPVGDRAPRDERGSERFFRAGLVGVFTAWAVAAVWENQFPKGLGTERYAEVFGSAFDLRINLVLFSLFLGQALGFFALRLWDGWPHRGATLVGAALLMVTSQIAVVVAVPLGWLQVFLFAGGVGFAIFYSHSLYHAQAGRADKGRRSAIHEAALSAGFVLSPPIAGSLVVATGAPVSAFYVSLALACLCLAVTLWFVVRGRVMRS